MNLQLRRIIQIVTMLALFTVPIFANDTAISVGGGNVRPMDTEHPQVQMVSEDIQITLSEGHALVRCEFVFKNHGPETKLVMGFPEYLTGEDGGENDYPTVIEFKTFVNNKQIPVQRQTENLKSAPKYSGTDYWRPDEDVWYTWPMKFKKNQTLKVINTYKAETGRSEFTYYVETGANWKGVIEKGTFTFRFGQYIDKHFVVQVWPESFVINDEYIKWEFKNYEPDISFDIYVSFIDPRWESSEMGLFPDWNYGCGLISNPGRDYLDHNQYKLPFSKQEVRIIRNGILARHGYIFQDKKLSRYFKKKSWYKPNPNFKMSQLSHGEMLYSECLLGLEKSLK